MYDTAVPTIATVATGARALMAKAREVAAEASKGTVSVKKKNCQRLVQNLIKSMENISTYMDTYGYLATTTVAIHSISRKLPITC